MSRIRIEAQTTMHNSKIASGPEGKLALSSKTRIAAAGIIAGVLTAGILLTYSLVGPVVQWKKQYWATSLTRNVDPGVLLGLDEAVTRGNVGWLDIDPKFPLPGLKPGINVILYHVGGNCYIGRDCARFPASQPTGDMWGDTERMINLNDPAVRKIVVADLIEIVRRADQVVPAGAIVGVHLDNVHRLDAQGVADIFNEYLKAIESARDRQLISKDRKVGYIAKNNPRAFKEALDNKLLATVPLYQINENAKLSQDGTLDADSRVAQEVGRQYCIPVFLKTFGTDVAYTIAREGENQDVYVSEEMTSRMAEMPNISGAAWSIDEQRYHPTIFVQGSPVPQSRLPFGSCPTE
jgi:hypothetical protein